MIFKDTLVVALAVKRMRHSIRDCYCAFKLDLRVRPIHLNDLKNMTLENENSSPGLPWKERGFSNKKQDPEAWRSIRFFWHRIKNDVEIQPPDCAAYLESHIDDQVRAVWEYPAMISFQEACFALPLIDACKCKSPIAYGYVTASGGCRRLRKPLCPLQQLFEQ